ncbi:MAG: CopG family transcriptional regulator [Egibacteraceae bacterium]
MKRTMIVAEESVLHRLHQLADTRGISFGEIVREALEEKLEREQPPLTFLDVPFEPPPGWPSAREYDEESLYRPRGCSRSE